MSKKVAVTCLKPSDGGLHLGHYIGNILPLIQNQEKYDCYFIFGNLQLINTIHGPEVNISQNMIQMTKQMIALGVKPEKVKFLLESDIKSNRLLDFIEISDLVSESRIKRLPVFKNYEESIKMSMLLFPVLQILDFFILDADYAFSNIDNKPAVELANEVLRKVKSKKCKKVSLIHGPVEFLVGFDGTKMSKSKGNCIFFSDSKDEITKKVNKMYTDPNRVSADIPGNINNNVVFKYLKAFLDVDNYNYLVNKYENAEISDSETKKILTELLCKLILECQNKATNISDEYASSLIKNRII